LDKLIENARAKLIKAGNNTRFWCEENQYSTDIARCAAERAMADAGIEAKEIDLLIYTGMSKAFVEPATGHVLRHELGALNANVIDTQDACSSFIKSIEIADSLIKTEKYRTILIAAGERTYDWADFTCKTVDELAWKFGSLTIGDAAGALVLQKTAEPQYLQNPFHLRAFYKLVDGEYATCHIGLNYRFGERYRLHSNSSRLVRLGMQSFMDLAIDVIAREEFSDFHCDSLFVHDIGSVIDEVVIPFMKAANLPVPENYRSYYPRFGNVASASLPLGMDLAKQDGRLQRGNLAVFVCPAAGVQTGVLIFVY
jgi:3-oxoacyl-[acyl-carrier-protein] synthase-3